MNVRKTAFSQKTVTMKKCKFFWMFAFVFAACHNTVDLYDPTQGENTDKGGLEYAEQFSNDQEITVSIHTLVGTYYALFTAYPYGDEGNLVETPVVQGNTPIDISVSIPKDVEKLYLLSWEGVQELAVQDVVIDESSNQNNTRSDLNDTQLRELRQAAYNLFPEMVYNFRREELYKCTDLVIAETESSGEFETANVSLTYLGDGGFGTSGNDITLYMYTYPTEKRETLTLDDVTFYGLDRTTMKPMVVSYDDVYDGRYYIFKHRECRNSFPVANMGDFPKGVNVGFCMNGTRTNKLKFSTPALNPNDMYVGQTIVDKGTKVAARSSNMQTLYYNDGKGDFTFDERHVSSCFIQHYVATDGNEYNILGCDNTLPFEITPRTDGKFQCSFDGDYNDFLAMVETNPNKIQPNETIIGEETKVSSTEHGYYLFEDQYPEKGDFDFNDVVVEYKATHYENKTHKVDVRVVAKGCRYNNTFGFYDDFGSVEVIKNILGYQNVSPEGPWEIDEDAEWTTVNLTGTWKTVVTPYLYNGNGEVSKKTYNTDNYPYVLDIPYNTNNPFRWCIESQPIDKAYKFNSGNGWYNTPIDESLVITR
jgi:hypothetical protein